MRGLSAPINASVLALAASCVLCAPAVAADCKTALAQKPQKIADLYKRLSAIGPEKGEYETTTQYEKRMAALAAPSFVSASVPMSQGWGTYDADSGVLTYPSDTVAVLFEDFDTGSNGDSAHGIKQEGPSVTKKSVGQNAFGAKVIITTVHSDYYYLAVDKPGMVDLFPKYSALSVPLPPNVAKASRPYLEFVVGGVPDRPPVGKSGHYSGATLDAPIETFGETFFVTVTDACIGIRDSRSGAILAADTLLPGQTAFDPSATDGLPQPMGALEVPPYPAISKRLGEHGTTELSLTVAASGSVTDVSVTKTSSSDRLDQAAKDWALFHWQFHPAVKNGTPVLGQVHETVVWDLANAQ